MESQLRPCAGPHNCTTDPRAQALHPARRERVAPDWLGEQRDQLAACVRRIAQHRTRQLKALARALQLNLGHLPGCMDAERRRTELLVELDWRQNALSDDSATPVRTRPAIHMDP